MRCLLSYPFFCFQFRPFPRQLVKLFIGFPDIQAMPAYVGYGFSEKFVKAFLGIVFQIVKAVAVTEGNVRDSRQVSDIGGIMADIQFPGRRKAAWPYRCLEVRS